MTFLLRVSRISRSSWRWSCASDLVAMHKIASNNTGRPRRRKSTDDSSGTITNGKSQVSARKYRTHLSTWSKLTTPLEMMSLIPSIIGNGNPKNGESGLGLPKSLRSGGGKSESAKFRLVFSTVDKEGTEYGDLGHVALASVASLSARSVINPSSRFSISCTVLRRLNQYAVSTKVASTYVREPLGPFCLALACKKTHSILSREHLSQVPAASSSIGLHLAFARRHDSQERRSLGHCFASEVSETDWFSSSMAGITYSYV